MSAFPHQQRADRSLRPGARTLRSRDCDCACQLVSGSVCARPASLLGRRAVDTARVCRPCACSVRRAPPAVHAPTESTAIASIAMAGCVVLLQLLAAVFVWPGNRAVEDEFVAGGDIMDLFTTYDAVNQLEFPLYLAAYIVTCMWLWVYAAMPRR